MYPTEDLIKKLDDRYEKLHMSHDPSVLDLKGEVMDLIMDIKEYFEYKKKPFMEGMSNSKIETK